MIVASVNINVRIVIDGGKVQTHGEVLHKNVIIVAMEYMLTNRHVYNQENLIWEILMFLMISIIIVISHILRVYAANANVLDITVGIASSLSNFIK